MVPVRRCCVSEGVMIGLQEGLLEVMAQDAGREETNGWNQLLPYPRIHDESRSAYRHQMSTGSFCPATSSSIFDDVI